MSDVSGRGMVSGALVTVVAALAMTVASSSAAFPVETRVDAEPVLLNVGYETDAAAAAAAVRGSLLRDLPGPRVALVLAEPARADALGAASPHVRYVERPGKVVPELADPLVPAQWALEPTHLREAWAIQPGSPDVVIAVPDTGVDATHVDLEGRVWSNPREHANGVDDDGNGYVDDVQGYDFCSDVPGTDRAPPSTDGHYHGTFIAGIAAAERGNGVGIAGAGGASVMPLRIFGAGALRASPCATTAAAAAAVTYAADHGARVISMSWRAQESAALRDALWYAWAEKGVLLVKSAGNENGGPVTWPASLPFVAAVSATHADGGIAPFSSQDRKVTLAAPGENIVSTTPGNSYAYGSGTSFAAPHVAGIAALVVSECPHLDAPAVWATLNATATDAGEPGHDLTFGHGIVNARDAVLRCHESLASPPASTVPPGNHAPVLIDGDADFCDGDDDGVVNCDTADGSPERPFVISGWDFVLDEDFREGDPVAAIEVRFTNAHFVIRDNVFRDSREWVYGERDFVQAGVKLVDVEKGTAVVEENHFRNVGAGVVLDYSPATVRHNTMRNVWMFFVWVDGQDYGHESLIERNVFQDSPGKLLASMPQGLIGLAPAGVTIRFNNFGGNLQLNVAETGVHSAALNWWGDARGPDVAGLQADYEIGYRGFLWQDAGYPLRDATEGDQVLHARHVAPWLTEPVADAGASWEYVG